MPKDDTGRRARHVAIIMDGNGRWARSRGLPRLSGHKQGVETVRKLVDACPDFGVEYLTLFAFSTENWKRSDEEISGLMQLFRSYMKREAKKLAEQDVRVRFLGRREDLAPDIQQMMADLEESTSGRKRFGLNVALNHGGRDEITRATHKIARAVKNGDLDPEAITEDVVSGFLDTVDVPDPCLIVRTSGEYRISNFLLWQAAYAEYAFVDALWPDFTPEMLGVLLDDFASRERRFGAAV